MRENPAVDVTRFKGRIFMLSADPKEQAFSNLMVARKRAKQLAVEGSTCAIYALKVPGNNQYATRDALCMVWNRELDDEVVEVWEPAREHVGSPGVYFAKCTQVEGYDGN